MLLLKSRLNNVEASLPADQSDTCEGLLTVEECFAAFAGMARGKAQVRMASRPNSI